MPETVDLSSDVEILAPSKRKRTASSTSSDIKSLTTAGKKKQKALQSDARVLIKTLGDGIKEGLKLVPPDFIAIDGTIRTTCTLSVFTAVFGQNFLVEKSTEEISGRLPQKRLVEIFGTTKIEKGGGRDARFVCNWADINFNPETEKLTLSFHPLHKGSSIWWKN